MIRFPYVCAKSLAAALVLSACGGSLVPSQQPVAQSVFPSPVAFVTPETPPVAAPTATQPAIPTNTPAPATAVPKREPQLSSNAIGLWASSVPNAQFPGFVDIAAGSGADAYRASKNQLLVSLSEQQAQTGFADTAALSVTLATDKDAVLYDKAGKIARAANTEPLLNIRSEAVRKQIADRVAESAQSADGVLVSNVGDELIRVKDAPIFTGTKAFTDQQRRDAVEGLLRAIRARVGDKLLIVGGYAWRDGVAYAARSSEALDLGAIVDGVHIEAFARTPISPTTEFKSEASWKRDIDMLAELSKDNRIVLLTTRVDANAAGDELTRQWINYAVASYLLGKNGTHTYFEFDGGDAKWSAEPVLSAPVGAPAGDFSKHESGLYTRRFERGLVLVNPTAESRKYPIDGGFRTLSGTPVEVSVTLSPRTGLVLIN